MSRYLQGLGMKVVVANPRKVRAIYQNERKGDRREAGLRLAKKRAVVLFTIWKRREPHQPFPALA